MDFDRHEQGRDRPTPGRECERRLRSSSGNQGWYLDETSLDPQPLQLLVEALVVG